MFTSLPEAIRGNMPSVRIDSPQNMLKKAQRVALPAIAIVAASSVQGASAIGCIGCIICLASGVPLACIPICILCGVTIPAPLGVVSSDMCDLSEAPA